MTGPKIYFTIPLFGGIPITQTTVSSFVVMVLLCIAGICLGRNLQKRPGARQVLVEKGVTVLYDMVADTMGPHNLYWTPYVGALFLSSLFGASIVDDRHPALGHGGSFHHADLGTHDQCAVLGLRHPCQRLFRLAERFSRNPSPSCCP